MLTIIFLKIYQQDEQYPCGDRNGGFSPPKLREEKNLPKETNKPKEKPKTRKLTQQAIETFLSGNHMTVKYMVSLREKYPLEKIKPLKKTISSLLLYFFVIVFISIFSIVYLAKYNEAATGTLSLSSWIWSLLWIPIALFIVATCLKYIYEIYYLKNYFYDLVGKNLIIRKGVFSRNEITLPMNRLQDVYVDQDILDRIFRLYDVHVSSATMISAYLSHIDGLNKPSSEAIKSLILSGIHKKNA